MTRIVGVDPGLVTGLVSFSVEDNTIHCLESYELDHFGIGQYFEGIKWSSSIRIVVEAFIITPQTARNSPAPWSLETIGIVRYFCGKAGVPLFLVAPSSHKRLVTDDVLKRAGLYFKGKGHATDAGRVALYHVLTDLKLMGHVLKGGSDGAG